MGNKVQNLQDIMGDKVSFLNLLQAYDKKNKYPLKSNQFIPDTYIINLKNKNSSQTKELYNRKNDKFWIVKAPKGYGGDGNFPITLLNKLILIIIILIIII